jgi:hypothetical protein
METLKTRFNEVARIAVRLEKQTTCPAQPLIAQWAIELPFCGAPLFIHYRRSRPQPGSARRYSGTSRTRQPRQYSKTPLPCGRSVRPVSPVFNGSEKPGFLRDRLRSCFPRCWP